MTGEDNRPSGRTSCAAETAAVSTDAENAPCRSSTTWRLPPNFFGYLEAHRTERIEGDVWILGGHTIERDRNGNIVREEKYDLVRVQLNGYKLLPVDKGTT